jgi:cytosine/adenosine deaminase-related metal-dependent hydrolase
MFEEMRGLAHNEPSLSPKAILEMATTKAARALGMASEVGELSSHAFADLIAIPFAGGSRNVYEAVLHHKGHVRASMIGGQWHHR